MDVIDFKHQIEPHLSYISGHSDAHFLEIKNHPNCEGRLLVKEWSTDSTYIGVSGTNQPIKVMQSLQYRITTFCFCGS
jgi:hypothetical protein